MKTSGGTKRGSHSTRAHRKESAPSRSDPANQGDSTPSKSESTEKYKTALRSYRFQRARTPGIIEVLNENSYVMAEYSERTGAVKWQGLLLQSPREQIEKWLKDNFS